MKRIVDGAMRGMWATEMGSRRTGEAMKVDAHDHKRPRALSVTEGWRRNFNEGCLKGTDPPEDLDAQGHRAT